MKATDDPVQFAELSRRVEDVLHAGMRTTGNDEDPLCRLQAERLLYPFQFPRSVDSLVQFPRTQ